MKLEHEMSPRELHRALRVHYRTCIAMLKRSLAGKPSPIPAAAIRRNALTGRFYIDRAQVAPLLGQNGQSG